MLNVFLSGARETLARIPILSLIVIWWRADRRTGPPAEAAATARGWVIVSMSFMMLDGREYGWANLKRIDGSSSWSFNMFYKSRTWRSLFRAKEPGGLILELSKKIEEVNSDPNRYDDENVLSSVEEDEASSSIELLRDTGEGTRRRICSSRREDNTICCYNGGGLHVENGLWGDGDERRKWGTWGQENEQELGRRWWWNVERTRWGSLFDALGDQKKFFFATKTCGSPSHMPLPLLGVIACEKSRAWIIRFYVVGGKRRRMFVRREEQEVWDRLSICGDQE